MKKIRYPVFVIIFLLAMLLCGCSGRSGMGDLGKRTYLQHFGGFSFNDSGVVFGQNFSVFFDPVSGESAPLCTKLNCTHDNVDCDACHNTQNSCTAVIGDYQYFVDSPQIGVLDFYRADVDGRNRKRLHRVEGVESYWYGSYEEGYLIYCYRNSFDEHGQQLKKEVSGICLLNLETEELERIEMPAAYSAMIDEATIDQGVLYYTYSDTLKAWEDYSYEEISSGIADDQRRTELWKYELDSKEKTCLWERKFTETDRPMLGYGHIYINASYFGGEVSLGELSSGKTVKLEQEGEFAQTAVLADEGLLLSGSKDFSLWYYDGREPEMLGTYGEEYHFIPQALTEHWVYAERFCGGTYEGLFYAPRDGFMKGEAEWKLIPGTGPEEPQTAEAGTGEPFVSEFADYPDGYFVKWGVWGGADYVEVSPQTLEEINRKLKEDGYGFGLKILYVEDTGNVEDLAACGADIASTGIVYAGGYVNAARDMFEKQLFEPLDERLEGSRLYDAIPRLCWEKVRYQGTLYAIPSEDNWDCRCCLLLNRRKVPDGLPEQFSGDLFELGNYLSKEYPMYYNADFSFAEALGYAFDPQGGVLIRADATMLNPLEEESVVEWLRTVNRWYQEGKIQTDFKKINQCSLAFTMRTRIENYQEYASWDGYVYHYIDYSTGILADSQKKDEAFSILELFHTDHSYGDLLIYGKENLDRKPEEISTARKGVYGLATGLKWGEDLIMPYFATAEEKKRYYDEHFLPSPCLYTEFPDEGRELCRIEREYLEQLITCDDFDAMLKEFREELKGPMETVLEKLAAQ